MCGRTMNNTPSRDFVVPSDNDVLCGRGRVAFKSPGNVYLRALIVGSLEDYKRSSRCDKTTVIRRIICDIVEGKGGRFLQHDKITGQWYDGGITAAKNRVGAAFRDAATPDKVKCIEKLKKVMLQQNLTDPKRLIEEESRINSPSRTNTQDLEERHQNSSYSLILPQYQHTQNSQQHGASVDIGVSKLRKALQNADTRTVTDASVSIASWETIDSTKNDLIRKIVFFNATRDASMGPDSLVRSISAYDASLDAMEASFKLENELVEGLNGGPLKSTSASLLDDATTKQAASAEMHPSNANDADFESTLPEAVDNGVGDFDSESGLFGSLDHLINASLRELER